MSDTRGTQKRRRQIQISLNLHIKRKIQLNNKPLKKLQTELQDKKKVANSNFSRTTVTLPMTNKSSMAGFNVCRLCRKSCNDSLRLYDANGATNEIYAITVKFFQPMFLELENNSQNQISVLCMECWHHISSFNNFQQTIVLIHSNLHSIAESVVAQNQGLAEEVSAELNLKSVNATETISIAHDDEFIEGNAGERKLNVTDCGTTFEADFETNAAATYSSNIPSNESTENVTLDTNEDAIDTDEEEDIVYGDLTGGDNCDIQSITSSEESNGLLQECTKSQTSNDSASANSSQNHKSTDASFKCTSKNARSSRRDKDTSKQINENIAKWIPRIKCRLCPKVCKKFGRIKRHYHTHHPEDEFYVTCCGRKFKYRYRMEDHVLSSHLNPSAFKCSNCDKKC
ncbi:transcription factor grauzone-like, partial [Musca vetustissima]|uniref:transcription factor grauzone-like n=1 Tax=Musca vetustissima TaxID=27455 RepID=UPI002AB5E2E8